MSRVALAILLSHRAPVNCDSSGFIELSMELRKICMYMGKNKGGVWCLIVSLVHWNSQVRHIKAGKRNGRRTSPMLLKDKVIVITGGATGIGSAIVRKCLEHGAMVACNHHPSQSDQPILATFKEHSTQGKIICVAGDIKEKTASEELIRRAVEKWGRIDGVVVNAGICQFYDFLDLPEDVIRETVDVNLVGAILSTQAAGKQFAKQQGGGSIIGIASVSMLVGGGRQVHYTPTKAGIHSLMQSSAIALGKYGVRCNSILPGTIETRLNAFLLQGEDRIRAAARQPIERVGEPDDIAGPAVFLLSDMSKFMSGSQLLVDGGMVAKCGA